MQQRMNNKVCKRERHMPIEAKATDRLPQFEARNEKGRKISSSDFIGKTVVVFFYLKDDTSACTQEACLFRDTMKHFLQKNVLILGISPDSDESHKQFAQKHALNFSIISDPDLSIASLFGATEKGSDGQVRLVRSTFLVDSRGKIIWKEQPVALDGHISRVLDAISNTTKK